MVNHLELLAKLFGEARRDDALPLFPQASGQTVSAEAMTAVIEALAVLIGESVLTPDGRNRFGKHSWRSTGAVYLTGLGVEVFNIQLLARWASEVVTHYTRLAPLKTITADYKKAILDRSGDKPKETSGEETKRIAKLKHSMDATVKSMQEEFKRLDDMIKAVELSLKPSKFVRNRKTNVVHRVLCGFEEAGDSAITFCGWRYAAKKVTLQKEAPDKRKETCKTCLPALRASLAE